MNLPYSNKIIEGNYFGTYTCRACIRTRANTGKYSWRIFYVLVSCQGVLSVVNIKLASLEMVVLQPEDGDEGIPSILWETRLLSCDLVFCNSIHSKTNSLVNLAIHTLRIFSGYFKPFGLFPFCKVIFGDPPKRPFKTSTRLTSLGLF